MSELQIKKITSSELSKTEVFLLNFYYRTAPSDFVVLYVKKRNMLIMTWKNLFDSPNTTGET